MLHCDIGAVFRGAGPPAIIRRQIARKLARRARLTTPAKPQ
jgi:hypothetical protein